MTDTEHEKLTKRLEFGFVVLFVFLGLAAFEPMWGYAVAALAGAMAAPTYRWYAELFRV